MFASKVREVHLAQHPRLLLQRQRVPVRLRLPLTRRSTRPLQKSARFIYTRLGFIRYYFFIGFDTAS